MKNVYSRSFESAPPPRNIDYSKGFTLAEVLITLGIIGIVAAITMPTLIQNYQKKEAAIRLEQAYSIISQAVKMSELANGPIEYWEINKTNNSGDTTTTKTFVEYYIKPYIKNINSIQMKTSGMPYEYYYYTRDGKLVTGGGHTHYSLALVNGVYLHFNASYGTSNKIDIRIDTNGEKRPNIIGRDTFFATIYPKYELYGTGMTRTQLFNLCKKDDYNSQKNCSGLIQADGWEIKKDYPW